MPLTPEQIATIDFPNIVSNATMEALMDPPIPAEDPVIDQEKLAQWVELHDNDAEKYGVATVIAENITSVSFDEFYTGIRACAQQLNRYFAQSNLKANELIIAD